MLLFFSQFSSINSHVTNRSCCQGEKGVVPQNPYILQHGELTIKEYTALCVDTPRRSLQRDLKNLVDKGLLRAEGATNQLIYKHAP